MTPVAHRQPGILEVKDSRVAHVQESISDSHLRATVLFTTKEGTLAALKAAQDLSRNLRLKVALVAIEPVSIHFPLDRPHIPVDFLEQRSLALLRESGMDAEEISIKLYLCRDRRQCLQRVLSPRSLIIMGGKKSWFAKREKRIEQWLQEMGHPVIFIDVKRKQCDQSAQLRSL